MDIQSTAPRLLHVHRCPFLAVLAPGWPPAGPGWPRLRRQDHGAVHHHAAAAGWCETQTNFLRVLTALTGRATVTISWAHHGQLWGELLSGASQGDNLGQPAVAHSLAHFHRLR